MGLSSLWMAAWGSGPWTGSLPSFVNKVSEPWFMPLLLMGYAVVCRHQVARALDLEGAAFDTRADRAPRGATVRGTMRDCAPQLCLIGLCDARVLQSGRLDSNQRPRCYRCDRRYRVFLLPICYCTDSFAVSPA